MPTVNSTPLDDERRRLGRLAFGKWLVASGRVTDGPPDLCPACGRLARYAPMVVARLVGMGYPACANRCACGLLNLPVGAAL